MAKKVETVETGLSVAGQFTEESIPSMLKEINDRIGQLTFSKEKKSKFTGTIMGETLSEIKDSNKLHELYTYITRKGEAINGNRSKFTSVAPTAKLKEYTEEGVTPEELGEFILERYAEITHEEELETLRKTKTALEDCLSEEAKKKARLESLGQTLASILKK